MSVQNFLKSAVQKVFRLIYSLLSQWKGSPAEVAKPPESDEKQDVQPPTAMAMMGLRGGRGPRPRPRPRQRPRQRRR